TIARSEPAAVSPPPFGQKVQARSQIGSLLLTAEPFRFLRQMNDGGVVLALLSRRLRVPPCTEVRTAGCRALAPTAVPVYLSMVSATSHALPLHPETLT